MKKSFLLPACLVTFTSFVACAQTMPFGSVAEQDYGTNLWRVLETAKLVGEDKIMAWPYEGNPPHGDKLVTLESRITVNGQTGPVLVKHNYGPDVSLEEVSNNPAGSLVATTVMFKRQGYDSDNRDWFFAKYLPDASYDVAPDGSTPLVGSPTGCVTCHSNAPGSDMVFLNNKY